MALAGAWCKEPLARFCSCPWCPTHCGDTVSTAPHWIHGPTLDPWPHIGSMAPHWPLPWLQQGRCGRTQMPALMHLCRKWSFVRGTSPSQGLLRTIPALARSGLAPAVCTDLGAVSALSFPFRRALSLPESQLSVSSCVTYSSPACSKSFYDPKADKQFFRTREVGTCGPSSTAPQCHCPGRAPARLCPRAP